MSMLKPVTKLFEKSGNRAYEQPSQTYTDVTAVTLDELWNKAASYGRIKIDWDLVKEVYTCRIWMKVRGNDIMVNGFDKDIREAMSQAIQEAERYMRA